MIESSIALNESLITLLKCFSLVFVGIIFYGLTIPIYYHYFGCSTYPTFKETAIAYWKHCFKIIKRWCGIITIIIITMVFGLYLTGGNNYV